ncbi:hypothetical protein BKA70DRAFT_1568110 [Coprinopsis sp. MPI-PUGE-AT-0042]|nr:hypothetical protein BKA70DRAFT_1568110 [Coprinopsis sp. MPI-PUGE-AT-0042]
MPFRFRVEDTAPFLTYSEGHWRLGRDPLNRFSQNSFTITEVRDATVSFNFYGTALEFYGARRTTQGVYRVSIDGIAFDPENATVTEDVFNVPLFTASGLPRGEHSVRLENFGGRWRDLDYVAWDQSVGDDSEEVQVYTLQDSDPSFSYQPPSSWGTNPPNVEAYSGGNGHATNVIGASARLRFRGDAIALYGPSGAQAAQVYSVQVNNRTAQSFTAAKFGNQSFRPKELMYFGGNLGEGEHELIVTLNSVSSAQQFLAIDYVEIFTTRSIGGGCSATSGERVSSSSGNSSSPPTGLIVAVAITGSLAVICLALLIWIFMLVKKGRLTRPSTQPPSTHSGHPHDASFVSTPFLASSGHRAHNSGVGTAGHDSLYHRPDWGGQQSPTTASPLNGNPAAFSDTATFTSASSGQVQYAQPIRKDRHEIPQPHAQQVPPPVYSDS